jgi:hypothetical protein
MFKEHGHREVQKRLHESSLHFHVEWEDRLTILDDGDIFLHPSVTQRTQDTMEQYNKKRQERDPPTVIAEQGWRYHHLGIPTTMPRPGEQYLKHLKIHVSGFDTSPYGIEWMRFEADCPITDVVKTIPHIAFEVDDLDRELEGKTLIGPVSSPMEGVRVAMIIDNGAPIELLQFTRHKA